MTTTWYDTVATPGVAGRVHGEGAAAVARLRRGVSPPLQTAKAFATLDALSGGRAILGVGAGHVEGEFDALGVPFS